MAESLNSYLVKNQCYCLNEEPAPHSHTSIIDFSGNALKSNADEQLLLHLSLNTTVKLTSLRLLVPVDNSCPCTVKLYVNRNSLGFSDAEGMLRFKFVIAVCPYFMSCRACPFSSC